MKYLLNLGTGALDDVETPKLGEKYFASAETDEIIKQINDQYGPGTMFPASEAPQPEIKTPQSVFEFGQRNPAADGGMMRQNFADNPLKNFDMFTIDNIPKGYGSAIDLSEKLGIKYDTLKTIKSNNSPPYKRLIEYLGEPIKVQTSRAPGGGGSSSIDYFNISDLTPEVIEAYKTKQPYPDRGGQGVKVLSNKNLKQKFIKAYNDGYSGRDIMSVIDPDNKLNINQEKYGSQTLTQLLNSEQVKPRKEGFISKGQEIYFEKNRIPIDNQIVKVNSFYKPGMSIEKVTQKLFPNFSPIVESDSFNVRQEKTNQLKEASNRIVDYKAWLKGDRPTSSILDKLTLPKNKKEIVKYIEARTDLTFGKYASAQERRYKYYQLDKLNNKPMGYYDGLNKKIYADFKRLGLNYQIEHGGSLSQSLKKKIPWVSKFVTFMKPKYNRQKIPLDMDTGILKAYDVLENNKLSVEEKKNHPDVKKHNKDAKEFMQKTGTKIPVISFNEKDVNKIIDREDVDKQTKTQVKNTFDKNGWTLINPGDQIEEVVKIVKDADKLPSNRKQLIVSGFRNKIANFFQDAPVPKGVKLPIGATAAALDFAIFNGLMGMPAPEAMLGSSQWLLKNPEAAEKIGKSINLVIEGKMTVDSFFNKNSEELGGVFKQLVGIDMPDAYSKNDEVGNQRLQEMDAAMAVRDLKEMPSTEMDETTAAPLYDFANGGRINYENGSPRGPNEPEGDNFLNELEFKFNNIDSVTIDDTPTTFDDSKSKIAQVADLANPRNIPYYADMAAQAALRVGEFGARVLPATGKLISDVLQKPMFKVKSSYLRDGDGEILDYGETTKEDNVKFVGGPIFKNFLENITPTSTEKLVGLDTIINEEKKKMIARGGSSLPVKVGETAALGGELVAPIFPGLKILRAFASAKGVKPTKEVAKTIEQQIDAMAKAKGMSRREFLQLSGAVGTIGLAKLLGISSELPKIAKTAEAVTSVAKTADGIPQYLYNLRNVIRLRGKLQPSSSTFLDGQEVYTYKGVTLYHNPTSLKGDGSFRIAKEFETNSTVPGEPSYNKVEMEVKTGEDVIIDEGLSTQKIVKAGDEYEEATAYPAREGGEDVDFYVEDDFHKQLEEISKELEEIDNKVEMFGYDK